VLSCLYAVLVKCSEALISSSVSQGPDLFDVSRVRNITFPVYYSSNVKDDLVS